MIAPSSTRRRGHRLRAAGLGPAALAALCFLVAACSPSGSDAGSDASTATASAGTGDASAAATASATSTAGAEPPASCPEIIPTVEVDKALGLQLPGVPIFTMGQPQPEIERLGRSTCLFGVQPDGSSGAVQATVYLYSSPEAASARIQATVSDTRDQGRFTEDVTAGDTPAVILIGTSDLTIIASQGDRTYSATLAYGVIAGTDQKPAVIKLMTAMLAAGAAD